MQCMTILESHEFWWDQDSVANETANKTRGHWNQLVSEM